NACAGSANCGVRPGVHAHAVIGDLDGDPVALEAAAQSDRAAVNARLQAVLDAVLNERLQQNAGHQDLERAWVDVFFDAQLVGAEADNFDVEVIVGELQ